MVDWLIERLPASAKPFTMSGRFDSAAAAQSFIEQMGWKARPVPTDKSKENSHG